MAAPSANETAIKVGDHHLKKIILDAIRASEFPHLGPQFPVQFWLSCETYVLFNEKKFDGMIHKQP